MTIFNRIEKAPKTEYIQRLANGKLGYQFCVACQRAIFYPRVLCPHCGETELSWKNSEGLGTVYASTTIPVRDGVPYNASLIDLDEGFRVLSRVEGKSPGDIHIGARVRAFVAVRSDNDILLFKEIDDESRGVQQSP